MRDRRPIPTPAMPARLCVAVAAALIGGRPAPCATADSRPRFRGPDGTGHHAGTPIPMTWGPTNVLWRRELPGEGHSSPVH